MSSVRVAIKVEGVNILGVHAVLEMFDVACLTEQPSNRLRLLRCVTELQLQGLSRGITYEQSYGYVHYKLP